MKRKSATRSALFTSIISLLLCVSMLMGTTFAWFTDSVESGINQIAAGNLDVELYHTNDTVSDDDVTGETELFKDVKLWEPGAVSYETLTVKNVGSLALKYQLSINFENETKVNGYGLSQALKVGIIDGALEAGTTRENLINAVTNWTPLSNFVLPGELEKQNDEKSVTVVIYWQPGDNDFDNLFNMNNGNRGETLSIDLGVKLVATQLEAEFDSFGKDYDENAWADGMQVYTADDLNAAIANATGETAIMLMADINLTKTLEIPANADIALNLNGKKLTAGTNGYVVYNQNGSTLTITDTANSGAVNGVVYTGTDSATIVEGGIYNAVEGGKYVFLNEGGSLTIDEATVNGGSNYPIYSYGDGHALVINDATVNATFGCINAYAAGTVEVNGGEFYMTGVQGKSSHLVYISGTTKATINGGTFEKIGEISMSGTGGGGICSMGSAEIVINGGSFAGDYRDLYDWSTASKITVNGGTYKFNPTSEGAKLGAGYKAVKNNGLYYVVPESVDNVITSAAQLQAALDAATGDTTIALAADITGDVIVSQKEGVNIVIDGNNYDYDGTIYVYGNSRYTGAETLTIKNVNFVTTSEVTRDFVHSYGDNRLTEQRYAHNVTIDNCTFTNENGGTVVAARFRQAYNITIKNCEVNGLFSVLWADGGNNIAIDNVTANCEFEGISFGTCSNVSVKNSNITVTGDYGYGVRVDANGDRTLTVENSTFTADASVVIRYATATYTAVLNGNTLNGDIILTNGNYKQGVALTAPTGDVKVIVDGAVYVETADQLINAIKNAPVGSETTIVMADGTYAGNIDITVAALGQSGGDVVIKAMEGAKPVITGTVTLGYRDQGTGATMYNANVTFEGITFDHVDKTLFSIEVGDVKSLNLVDCTIIAAGETGIHAARGNGTGPSKITGCTFINAAIQGYGNYCTGLIIEHSTFNNSRINIQAGNNVTVQHCVFNNTLTAANVGDSFYAIRSNSTPITVKDCKINIDSELTEVATAQAKWYLLANRGTTDWTVEKVKVTLTDAALAQTELKVTACTSTGKINTTELTVNGVVQE